MPFESLCTIVNIVSYLHHHVKSLALPVLSFAHSRCSEVTSLTLIRDAHTCLWSAQSIGSSMWWFFH